MGLSPTFLFWDEGAGRKACFSDFGEKESKRKQTNIKKKVNEAKRKQTNTIFPQNESKRKQTKAIKKTALS
ncbi:hypothetical protein A3SI_15026 [Nitritalea halalkaliphila LW7]|uniref:Uncharacterized protein n=1 Tax=Nitritalea halalkaliphila LW7 TaxID=1189621 RepID=I5BYV9_9BACT|nr:hypothetical protein [Nitritalea halalkaliphila]EIM74761.1 hypothetical protein A3SI_15026 [Nitritalea halalkaliphila LW7]